MVTKTNTTYEAPILTQSKVAVVNQVLCQSAEGLTLNAKITSLGGWQ